jgi:hypothetical protein
MKKVHYKHKKHIENEKEKNAMSAGITDMPAVFMQ